MEAEALNGLGEILRAAGRPADGMDRHRDALALARETADRDEQARSLEGIARALHATGRGAEARRYLQEALAIYTDLDVPEADELRSYLAEYDER